jgi:ABC-type uncharacterized transport system substrate-binding protein
LYVPLTIEHLQFRQLIAAFALEAKWPAVCAWRENAEAGALMAYSVDLADIFRRAARYIDCILKGARPAEMPIEQPTNFELVLNLGTVRALALRRPHRNHVRSLLVERAAQVQGRVLPPTGLSIRSAQQEWRD